MNRNESGSLAVLGGGPAGLAVAYYAHRAGEPFVLFEKAGRPGGLCQTMSCGRHRFDTGAHRFHDRDKEITRDLQELMPDRLVTVSRPSKVLISGRFLEFPPTPLGMLFSGGVRHAQRIGLDLVRARWHRKKIVSFADFAVQRFGRTLANKFLLNYSAKVWGLPPEQLSPAVATRRLSGMSLRSLVTELVAPGRKTSHLDGHFLYPTGGYGGIVDALVSALPADSIKTGHDIVGASLGGNRIRQIHFSNNSSWEVSGEIVSTLPLTFLVRILALALPASAIEASENLRFRHVRLIFLRLGRADFTENASIYIPDPEYCISRIYEPKNRCASMAPEGETGIVVEVPCFEDEPIAALPDELLTDRVISELSGLGLLQKHDVIEWRHHFLSNAYPVYSLDYELNVRVILSMLERFENLVTLGRNGLFYYSHLHDQMRMAKDFIASGTTRREAVAD